MYEEVFCKIHLKNCMIFIRKPLHLFGNIRC